MMITNEKSAAEWMAAWGGHPRRGVAAETVRGLRMSASISRSAGNPGMSSDYTAAADHIAARTGLASLPSPV